MALMIPIVLATQVRAILIRRRCLPAVLVHPHAPEHQAFLTGERYEVELSWPPEAHRSPQPCCCPHDDPARSDHLGAAAAGGLTSAMAGD